MMPNASLRWLAITQNLKAPHCGAFLLSLYCHCGVGRNPYFI